MSSTRYPQLLQAGRETAKDEQDGLDSMEHFLSLFFRCPSFPLRCQFTHRDADEFLDHLRLFDEHWRSIECHYCGDKSTTSPESLVVHYIVSHSHLLYQCNLCPFRAASQEMLTSHHVMNHSVNLAIAISDEAAEEFPSLIRSKLIVCENLVEAPPHLDAVRAANQLHPNPDADDTVYFTCPFCLFKCEMVGELMLHQLSSHPPLPVYSLEGREKKKKAKKSVSFDPSLLGGGGPKSRPSVPLR